MRKCRHALEADAVTADAGSRPVLLEPAAPASGGSAPRAFRPGALRRAWYAGWRGLPMPEWMQPHPALVRRYAAGLEDRAEARTAGLWFPGCGRPWPSDPAERHAQRRLLAVRAAARRRAAREAAREAARVPPETAAE